MHPPDSPLYTRVGMIYLHDGFIPTAGGQIIGTKYPGQKSTIINQALSFNELQIRQRQCPGCQPAHA